MSMLRTIPIQFTTLNTQLKQSFVIFVCTFDPFHIGRHVYTVENRCVEDTNLLLNDATQKIILNTKGIFDDVLSFCIHNIFTSKTPINVPMAAT